jgi:hypothetical protein
MQPVQARGEKEMTDSELLEKAAKAAGINALRDPYGCLRNCTGMEQAMNIFAGKIWNPLSDDGDALRLAVKLGIELRCDDKDAASAGWSANQKGAPTIDGKGPWYWKEWLGKHGNDTYAATRRAIVCAAAEIWKAK